MYDMGGGGSTENLKILEYFYPSKLHLNTISLELVIFTPKLCLIQFKILHVFRILLSRVKRLGA